jgi:energy-coupling factor transport system substrate-specific component
MPVKQRIKTYILLIVAYFLLAMPFKVMEVIPGFADIRPVTMLGPIYGLFFGLPGCIIFAFMNLVMDAVSGELMWSSIAGLIANFAGPLLITVYWNKVSKKPLTFRNLENVLAYSVTVILAAVLESVIITWSVALIYPDVNWKVFALSVVLNTAVFPIVFGVPLVILMQEELGFKRSKGLI